MAALNFLFHQSVAPGSTLFSQAQLGGFFGIITTGPGWEVQNKAAGQFHLLNGPFTTVQVSSGGWSGSALPAASAPDGTLGDAFRTSVPIFGQFANTDWTVVVVWQAITTAQDFRGRMSYRLWRGTDPEGAGATEITSGTFVSNTTTANIATGSSTTLTATWSPGGTVTLNGEYLFIQMAVEVTTQGTVTTGSVRLVSTTAAKLTTPDFTQDADAKVFYMKDAVPTGATNHRSLQDGGTITSANTGTGWVCNTNSAPNYCIMNGGTEIARTNGQWTTTAKPDAASLSTTIGDAWRTENALTGTFADKPWGFNFITRSITANYAGRYTIRARVYKSANQDGSSATELTSAVIETAATRVSSTTNQSHALGVGWDPGGALTFNNEYLFVQVAFRVTTVGTGTSQDINFRVGDADFAAIWAPVLSSERTVTAALNDTADAGSAEADVKVGASASATDAGDTLTAASATVPSSITASLTDTGDALAASVEVTTAETNATAALNDTADATAATALAPVSSIVSLADTVDGLTAASAALVAAALAQTDVGDALAATVSNALAAALAASDAPDALAGSVGVSVSLALTKMDDADSLVANVSGPGFTANLLDAPDSTAAFLTVRASASVAGIDAEDSLTASVILPVAVAVTTQDQADALSAGAEVAVSIQTNAADDFDTLAAQISGLISAQYNVTGAADALAATFTTFDAGDLLTNPHYIAVSNQRPFAVVSSQQTFGVVSSQPQFVIASSTLPYRVG